MRLLDLKILLVVLLALAGPVSAFAQEETTEATNGEETQDGTVIYDREFFARFPNAISVADLTEMVLEDRKDARAEKQYGTAIAADRLIADMFGHTKTGVPVEALLKGIVGLLSELDNAVEAKDITPTTINGTAKEENA